MIVSSVRGTGVYQNFNFYPNQGEYVFGSDSLAQDGGDPNDCLVPIFYFLGSCFNCKIQVTEAHW